MTDTAGAVVEGTTSEITADQGVTLVYTPGGPLLPFREYRVQCNEFEWTFTTGGEPTHAPPAVPEPLTIQPIAEASPFDGMPSLGIRVEGLLQRGTLALLDLNAGQGLDAWLLGLAALVGLRRKRCL